MFLQVQNNKSILHSLIVFLSMQLKTDYDAGREILCTVLKSCGEEVVIAVKNNTALEKTNWIAKRTQSISSSSTRFVVLKSEKTSHLNILFFFIVITTTTNQLICYLLCFFKFNQTYTTNFIITTLIFFSLENSPNQNNTMLHYLTSHEWIKLKLTRRRWFDADIHIKLWW